MFVLKHFGEPKVWVNKSEVFILKKKITVIHFWEKRCAGKCLEIIWKIVMVLSDCPSIIYCIWLNYSTLEHYWKYWLNFLTVTQLLIVIDWTIWFQNTYIENIDGTFYLSVNNWLKLIAISQTTLILIVIDWSSHFLIMCQY